MSYGLESFIGSFAGRGEATLEGEIASRTRRGHVHVHRRAMPFASTFSYRIADLRQPAGIRTLFGSSEGKTRVCTGNTLLLDCDALSVTHPYTLRFNFTRFSASKVSPVTLNYRQIPRPPRGVQTRVFRWCFDRPPTISDKMLAADTQWPLEVYQYPPPSASINVGLCMQFHRKHARTPSVSSAIASVCSLDHTVHLRCFAASILMFAHCLMRAVCEFNTVQTKSV